MVRGWERRVIFRDDADREDFVARLAAVAEAGALTVYAWALLPNHAHLLVRTGTRPLARSMRSLRLLRSDSGPLSGGDDLRRQPRGLDGARPRRGGVDVSCLRTNVPCSFPVTALCRLNPEWRHPRSFRITVSSIRRSRRSI